MKIKQMNGFTYVFGCRPLRWLSHRSGRQTKTCIKPEAEITVFELLMMGGVSSETCWAIKKHWNNKFYYTVASCWHFLWDLYYDARIHGHQVYRTVMYVSINKQIIIFQNCVGGQHNAMSRATCCARATGWSVPFEIKHVSIVISTPRRPSK